jgi:hypothetical protein
MSPSPPPSSPPRFLSLAAQALRAFTLAGLGLHFAATLLYVMPLNPIKAELGFLAGATIGTFFPQNWSLFAPTPVTSTQAVLVRCLTEEEVPRKSDDRLPPDGWQDISSAHFAQAQRHRLSAYERLVRPLQNSLREYLSGGPHIYPFHEACEKGDQDACKRRDELLKPARASAAATLRRIGSAYCREVFPRHPTAGVAIRYREWAPVPWSARRTGKPQARDYELGVYAVDDAVALPGLYLAKEAP